MELFDNIKLIEELKGIKKPFIIILNTTHPTLPETEKIKEELQEKYNVPVLPINIDTMTEKDMYNILREALYEFGDGSQNHDASKRRDDTNICSHLLSHGSKYCDNVKRAGCDI